MFYVNGNVNVFNSVFLSFKNENAYFSTDNFKKKLVYFLKTINRLQKYSEIFPEIMRGKIKFCFKNASSNIGNYWFLSFKRLIGGDYIIILLTFLH